MSDNPEPSDPTNFEAQWVKAVNIPGYTIYEV